MTFSTRSSIRQFDYYSRMLKWPRKPQIIYCTVTFLTTYIIILLYTQRPGLYVQCPCLSEIETEERVDKYLSLLMREQIDMTNRTAGEEAELEHPSLPVKFLTELEAKGRRCSLLPGLFDIKHRNSLWQEAQIGASTFLLFSAFIDHRDEEEGTLVRILAMSDSAWPITPTCHLYGSINDPPLATRAIRVDYIHWQYPKAGEWHPYLITCRAGTGKGLNPQVVSLVGYPCSLPTNAMRIMQYDKSAEKKNMALCHKFLFNPAQDYSLRLIEWLETARAWGIDRVTLYVTAIHSNVERVLKYYKDKNFVNLIPWANPGDQINVKYLLRALYDTQRYIMFTDENIPYTDCLLRHIGSHRYVGVWDIDEFVFPVDAKSIPDMVDAAFAKWESTHKVDPSVKPPTSYMARSSYFFDDNVNVEILRELFLKFNTSDITALHQHGTVDIIKFQSCFRILSHIIRTIKYSPPQVFTKSIHDTSRALGLHAHFALYNIEGRVSRETELYSLYPNSEGFLGHFRSKCQGENQTECNETFRPYLTVDKTMWHYANDIIPNSLKVMEYLDLF